MCLWSVIRPINSDFGNPKKNKWCCWISGLSFVFSSSFIDVDIILHKLLILIGQLIFLPIFQNFWVFLLYMAIISLYVYAWFYNRMFEAKIFWDKVFCHDITILLVFEIFVTVFFHNITILAIFEIFGLIYFIFVQPPFCAVYLNLSA